MKAGWDSVSYFIRRRLIRIVPLYWLATLIYSAKLMMQGSAPEWSDLIKSLFFVPYANDAGLMRPVLGVGWTLNFEMLFYFILGTALFFREFWRLPIVFFPMLLLVFLSHSGLNEGSSTEGISTLLLLSEDYLLFFLAGVCVALTNRKFAPNNLKITFFGAVVACTVALMSLVIGIGGTNLEWSLAISSELLVCSFCVWICTLCKSVPTGNQTTRLVTWTGDGSFSTYLFHGFVMGVAARVFFHLSLSISPFQFAILMVVLCTLVGSVIYTCLEKPILASLNSTWGQRKRSD